MNQYTQSIRGKLFRYFEGRLRLKRSTKGWWRTDCTDCGGHHTLGLHLEKKRVHCFKCGLELTPIALLMQMERFEKYSQIAQFLKVQDEYEYYDRGRKEVKEVKPVELPEGFHIITSGTNLYAKGARVYLKKRGFDIASLAMKGVGFCDAGAYQGYIIFPFYRKGQLIYFQGRIYIGSGTKMKNPPEEEFGVGKSSLIYNQDALYMYDKVYLVESITNAETLGDNAIAIQGKKISEYQLFNLLNSPCGTIIIILDPDAKEEAIKLAMTICHYKRVKFVRLPKDKDVNDIGKKATLNIVKSTPYHKYMDLLKLKNETTKYTHHRAAPNKIDRRGI